jgi:CubicO group peptidase (beta-lactamase class C family)
LAGLVQPVLAQDAADERAARIDQYLGEYVEAAAFDGVIVISDGGDIAFTGTYGLADYANGVPMRADARFRIASLSKQVTMAAIGRLADQGNLELTDKLSAHLPDFPDADRITIRQLIDHTSGVAHTNRLDWMDMRLSYTLDEIVAGLAREPLQFEPGEHTQYSNGGYALLAKIIELASGLSYGEFIEHEFGQQGYPSIGHESAYEVVPSMVSRYAPGPTYGERVVADTYMSVNRVGGGSLYGSASDVLRFFRDSYRGNLLSPAMSAALFPRPDDGDTRITGRSPGALAQVYLDLDDDLVVVTLSSNAAWPGSLNADVTDLYRGNPVALTPFAINDAALSATDREAVIGAFVADRFGWEWTIEPRGNQFAIRRNELHTAFVRTTDGEFHVPIYDWLCVFGDYGTEFECRQRDPDAEIRFRFTRR